MAKSTTPTEHRAARPRTRADRQRGFRHAVPELDRLIHERIRLGILGALAVNETLTFNDLKTLLQTTDGNISVHARKLEDAGYLACTKSFQRRVPKTEYRITATGRRSLERYLDRMAAFIRTTRDK